jgi:hypothetical protein
VNHRKKKGRDFLLVRRFRRSHQCDKTKVYIYWLRDERLEESSNLLDRDVLVQEIIDDLQAALEQFREIANDLGREQGAVQKGVSGNSE